MTYHSGNQMIDPQLLFTKGQLRPGMHVADLGCGRVGHLIFPGALRLGEFGIMYAVDVLKDVLENIKKRAAMDGLVNIHTVWADLEKKGQTHIPAHSLDLAFLVNVLVQANNRLAILDEALRLLKEKARLVIVDWVRQDLPFGPPAERRIDFALVKKWAKENGLVVQEEFSVGRYHQGIVLFRQV